MVSEDYSSDDHESKHSQEDLDFAFGNSDGIEASFSEHESSVDFAATLSESLNLQQILASVTTTDLLGFSPMYQRAHDENIALQTEIRVVSTHYDAYAMGVLDPYMIALKITIIQPSRFPEEFKAWNDVFKKLGKDVRKGTTHDFIQGEDGQPISLIQMEQIRGWIGTAWKECFSAKANDQRFLGKNYSQIDSTYTNQLLHAFIEHFPLLSYCDGYFTSLYILNAASYTRKRSIVRMEKKVQITLN
ncbi:hypothetical protein BT69DRAFT_1305953 [Atractiella rhizophila]|nr:hypothetical protein BT69DRAFT_1305953 [Atractiella rhizophila]